MDNEKCSGVSLRLTVEKTDPFGAELPYPGVSMRIDDGPKLLWENPEAFERFVWMVRKEFSRFDFPEPTPRAPGCARCAARNTRDDVWGATAGLCLVIVFLLTLAWVTGPH